VSHKPDYDEIYAAVYKDRQDFLTRYPKSLDMLEAWVSQMEIQNSRLETEETPAHAASLQAYRDQVKILKLQQLIQS